VLSESEGIQLFDTRNMLLPLQLVALEKLVVGFFFLMFPFELRVKRFPPKPENPLNL